MQEVVQSFGRLVQLSMKGQNLRGRHRDWGGGGSDYFLELIYHRTQRTLAQGSTDSLQLTSLGLEEGAEYSLGGLSIHPQQHIGRRKHNARLFAGQAFI